jgi:cytochrome c oxidase cbb3-type subunit I/II
MEKEKFFYDNKIVKWFAYATMLWGVVGMLVGLIVAFQFVFPSWNLNIPYTTFGRIRPLHTNAVIFAFIGNGIFMGVYYSLQRLCKASMFSKTLSKIHFWGWQLIIVLAAVSLVMGYTTGKEYAELEWPIDILIAVVWVVFGWNMLGTIIKRRERHIYVAIWFYIATFVTVAVLHIVNSIEIPVSLMKSYPVYAGVQDALVQWWYGHNAVAFFLTTPYLGMMYYFVPKAANRPVYSYRLSIIHFWALIFLYIWAGPHHLLYTSLPDWAQSVGTVFSIMLIAPSWGGMLNGLLTLRGVWDKVREDVVLKFMVVAITCYGMSTLEGPLLSIKSLNAITHFTDWTIAHVHVGALGWNGFLTFGVLYWLIPRIFQTKLHSKRMANQHFWIGTLGIIFYAIPMYWAGWIQSMMWKEFTADGRLAYQFLDTVIELKPLYILRAIGGTLYLTGALMMCWNLIATIRKGTAKDYEEAEAEPLPKVYKSHGNEHWHRLIERKPVQMLLISLVVILIGGIVEFIPVFMVKSNIPKIEQVTPYTPLELAGRDIYVKEGCYVCHSQMVRPFRSETARYGEYSKSGEFVYDHPFQWGSKRTGPDLAREGVGKNKKSHQWHYNHMLNPTNTSQGSIMPPYPWLLKTKINRADIPAKIRAMRKLGVPYEEGYDLKAVNDLETQAIAITEELKAQIASADKVPVEEIKINPNTEIIALISYLQRLGTDIGKTTPKDN